MLALPLELEPALRPGQAWPPLRAARHAARHTAQQAGAVQRPAVAAERQAPAAQHMAPQAEYKVSPAQGAEQVALPGEAAVAAGSQVRAVFS